MCITIAVRYTYYQVYSDRSRIEKILGGCHEKSKSLKKFSCLSDSEKKKLIFRYFNPILLTDKISDT